ncbi:hypothetical protein BJ912DRAFT_936177 [Pholiota molesta]|nr:hypothetical protein BJ912DRAFT_936177 [Pholiota molesta]
MPVDGMSSALYRGYPLAVSSFGGVGHRPTMNRAEGIAHAQGPFASPHHVKLPFDAQAHRIRRHKNKTTKGKESKMELHKEWHLTVLLLEGLRLMRPEKAWRPIISVEVDAHGDGTGARAGSVYETMLGVDGHPEASPSSRIEIKVWHRAQSKKKKRRILVANASCCLGELQKRQEGSSEGKLDVRLQCRTADQKSTAARGRPQKGAVLKLKLRALPSSSTSSSRPIQPYSTDTSAPAGDLTSTAPSRSTTLDSKLTDDSQSSLHFDENTPLLAEEVGSPVGSTGMGWPSEKSLEDDVPDLLFSENKPSLPSPPEQTLRRRRRIKGYAVYTDDESSSDDLVFRAASGEIDVVSFASTTSARGVKVWIATARDMLLPHRPADLNNAEKVLTTFTLYAELAAAEKEADFEPIIRRLQSEWAVVGGLLLAIAGVNTAMFTISSGSLFTVGRYAQAAIATSSVASGLGIAVTAWFFLRYNWADTHTFMVVRRPFPFYRSRDLFESHFFFALSARVPALCMFIAACALTACLALIAFATFPQGVLLICFLVGVLMSLQFIVFGLNWAARRVVQGGRRGGERVRVVCGA